MDILHNLVLGFQVALIPMNLLFCFVGVLIGTLVGVLPGIGPVGAMALLLPATFAVPLSSSLIMLAGIYYGAMYGGSTTANSSGAYSFTVTPGWSGTVVPSKTGFAFTPANELRGHQQGVRFMSGFNEHLRALANRPVLRQFLHAHIHDELPRLAVSFAPKSRDLPGVILRGA